MSGEAQFLSRSEFANLKGWSPSYVTKLGKQGRLVLGEDGRVNVPATLLGLQETEDPAKEGVRQHHAANRAGKLLDSDGGGGSSGVAADPRYWDAKARRENALAELADLELHKRQGGLVDRKRVESAAFGIGRTLRDAVLGLPTQLAPELAAMSDSFAIENKLRDALRQVFHDIAKLTSDDLNKAMELPH